MATRHPDLVIFDCDGVLVDSEPLAAACFSEALAELGVVRSPQQLDQHFRGRRLTDCLTVVETWSGRPLPSDFATRLQRRIMARFEDGLRPVDGVRAALEALRADSGIRVCVASSSEPAWIAHALRLTGLSEFFDDHLFSAVAVPCGKPAPDLFLHAASTMGCPPARCTVVEDSAPGIAGARAAGMYTFAYRAPPALAADAGRHDFDRMVALPGLLAARLAGFGVAPARLDPDIEEESTT